MADISKPLPIYRTRRAKEVRATLSAKQKITILEMDKYGFHVRGKASNGPVSGWTGWQSLLGNAPAKRAAVEKFRQRQYQLLKLITEKRPAIGMTLDELKLALGAPSKSDVTLTDGKNVRSAVWTKKKTVDTDEILGPLAILSKERELEIDTGFISATIIDGVATTIQIDLADGNNEVAIIDTPIQIPFVRVVTENQQAMAAGR